MSVHHSPAPWRIEIDNTDNIAGPQVYIFDKDHKAYPLAKVYGEDGEAQQLANARLICAAPDLLAACKWVMYVVRHKSFCPAAENRGDCDCGLSQVEKAITKAEEPTP